MENIFEHYQKILESKENPFVYRYVGKRRKHYKTILTEVSGLIFKDFLTNESEDYQKAFKNFCSFVIYGYNPSSLDEAKHALALISLFCQKERFDYSLKNNKLTKDKGWKAYVYKNYIFYTNLILLSFRYRDWEY